MQNQTYSKQFQDNSRHRYAEIICESSFGKTLLYRCKSIQSATQFRKRNNLDAILPDGNVKVIEVIHSRRKPIGWQIFKQSGRS